MWFGSLAAFNASFRDPFWDKLRIDDYPGFAVGCVQLVVKEHSVVDRTGSAARAGGGASIALRLDFACWPDLRASFRLGMRQEGSA